MKKNLVFAGLIFLVERRQKPSIEMGQNNVENTVYYNRL